MKITINFKDQKCTLIIIKLFKKINDDKYIYIYIYSNCGAKESVAPAQAQFILRSATQAEESHCRGRPPARHFTKRPKKGAN